MAGSELVGDIEFSYVKEVFKTEPAILYRYHPKAKMAALLEKRLADHFGVKYAHLVSSGTAAIETALFAAGVGPGDEVITTAFTFVAPIEAILKLGAIPVCVNIDETYNLSPDSVAEAITTKTKAVCAIPMWGPCDMNPLVKICDDNNITLVEDSAQALGGTYHNRLLGTFGKIGSFSLDFGKTLTAGEGGFIITDDEELYRRASEFADHGHIHDSSVPRGADGVRFPGFNYRMSELTAAVALGQLDRLGKIHEIGQKNRANISKRLGEIVGLQIRNTVFPDGEMGDTVITTLKDEQIANTIASKLTKCGVGTKILPEAFRWHFAGYWPHIWKNVGGYDLENLIEYWQPTYDLLARSVAINIPLNPTNDWEDNAVTAFKSVLQ